ncbi:MAG TPA: hypothetical protein VF767_00190 [Bryobacteraceae bacterium]
MLAHAGPILEAQWRTLRNRQAGGARIASLILWMLWYGTWAGMALLAETHAASAGRTSLRLLLPWAFLGLTFFWQVAPFLTTNLGASLSLRKLLLYPVPERDLFAVEMLVRLGTAAEGLLVLAGLTAGLLRNPSVPLWAPLPAVLLFAVLNLFLGVGLRSLMERLLAIRRVREAMVMLLVLCAALPQMLAIRGVPSFVKHILLQRQHPALPWVAAARLSAGDVSALSMAVLFAWTAAAIAFGWAQFRRSLRFDAASAGASGTSQGEEPGRAALLYSLPRLLFADPLAALVEKELRSLARAPRFRVLFLTGVLLGMLIWWPVLGGSASGPGQVGYPVVVSAYALTLIAEVAFWNQFGFDRGAARMYLASPVPFSIVLRAKNIAALGFVVLAITLVNALCALARFPLGPAAIVEAYAVTLTLALYFLAAGNISSVRFPRPINPEHAWGHAAPGRLQLYLLLLLPVFLAPLALAYVAGYAFESRVAFYVVLAFDAFAGGVAYVIATGSAVATAVERREQFLGALSHTSGPVSAE